MAKIYVKPGAGLKPRDPKDNQQIPESGKWIELDTYTRRRLADGDLVEAEPPADEKPKAAVNATKTTQQR